MSTQPFFQRLAFGLAAIMTSTFSLHAHAASSDYALLKGYCDGVSTQYDMNQCGAKAADATDKELNSVYQAVLKKWSNYPDVVRNLRESQRAWLAYRNADVTSRFTDEESQGSMRGTGVSFFELVYRMGLEHERTERLCQYLSGPAGGGGSRAPCSELVLHPDVIPDAPNSSTK